MTAVYSPRVMETNSVKVQQAAVTVFGMIISIIFVIYLITEICKEIRSVSNDQSFNMSDILEKSKIIEKILHKNNTK